MLTPETEKTVAVPEQELEQIYKAQEREFEWYKEKGSYETLEDVVKATERGELVPVPDTAGHHYRLSAKIENKEFRVLTPQARSLLEFISEQWLIRLQSEKQLKEKTFLVISSLTRSVEFQRRLEEKGFPTVEGDRSTHTKGGAFDISIEGFLKYKNEEALSVLSAVLEELARKNMLNFIPELSINVLHVAVHPDLELLVP